MCDRPKLPIDRLIEVKELYLEIGAALCRHRQACQADQVWLSDNEVIAVRLLLEAAENILTGMTCSGHELLADVDHYLKRDQEKVDAYWRSREKE